MHLKEMLIIICSQNAMQISPENLHTLMISVTRHAVSMLQNIIIFIKKKLEFHYSTVHTIY